MSVLKIINGTLEECEKEIIELEDAFQSFVNVVHARPVIEESALLGSGTGFSLPKVKQWQMLLQCE